MCSSAHLGSDSKKKSTSNAQRSQGCSSEHKGSNSEGETSNAQQNSKCSAELKMLNRAQEVFKGT